jgi:hypothetical protein
MRTDGTVKPRGEAGLSPVKAGDPTKVRGGERAWRPEVVVVVVVGTALTVPELPLPLSW